MSTSAVIGKLTLLSASALLPALALAQTPASPQPLTKAEIVAKLDSQMAQVLSIYNTIRGASITSLSPQDARQQFSVEDAAKILTRASAKAEAPMPVGKIIDGLAIDGQDANKIPIRIYTPVGEGPFPVTLYFHGGGFVIATIDTYDASARALCNYSGSIVVSVEYRKAPETPWPEALRDANSSYRWVINNIGRYNGIPTKVAVAGESAGGNLATEVAIGARNDRIQLPTHQLLIYPVTSSNLSQPSDALYTDPFLPLTTSGLEYFFKQYVSNPAEADRPEVSPIRSDLKGLPPVTIIAAELDPLLSDGQAYAAALSKAGVKVDYQLYPGVTHEFFGLGSVIGKAWFAEHYGAAALAASFKQ